MGSRTAAGAANDWIALPDPVNRSGGQPACQANGLRRKLLPAGSLKRGTDGRGRAFRPPILPPPSDFQATIVADRNSSPTEYSHVPANPATSAADAARGNTANAARRKQTRSRPVATAVACPPDPARSGSDQSGTGGHEAAYRTRGRRFNSVVGRAAGPVRTTATLRVGWSALLGTYDPGYHMPPLPRLTSGGFATIVLKALPTTPDTAWNKSRATRNAHNPNVLTAQASAL